MLLDLKVVDKIILVDICLVDILFQHEDFKLLL